MKELGKAPGIEDLTNLVIPAGEKQADPTQPMVLYGITPAQIAALAASAIPRVKARSIGTVEGVLSMIDTMTDGSTITVSLAPLLAVLAAAGVTPPSSTPTGGTGQTVADDATGSTLVDDATGATLQDQ